MAAVKKRSGSLGRIARGARDNSCGALARTRYGLGGCSLSRNFNADQFFRVPGQEPHGHVIDEGCFVGSVGILDVEIVGAGKELTRCKVAIAYAASGSD